MYLVLSSHPHPRNLNYRLQTGSFDITTPFAKMLAKSLSFTAILALATMVAAGPVISNQEFDMLVAQAADAKKCGACPGLEDCIAACQTGCAGLAAQGVGACIGACSKYLACVAADV
jgi:hypothetical protein